MVAHSRPSSVGYLARIESMMARASASLRGAPICTAYLPRGGVARLGGGGSGSPDAVEAAGMVGADATNTDSLVLTRPKVASLPSSSQSDSRSRAAGEFRAA